nr:unnamed protein product [Callosobruchus chinensis]
MSALKTYYSEEIRISLRSNQRPVTHFDLADLFGRAYLKVQTGERAVKGFAVTGLYPVRRDVFTEDYYLAANQSETGQEGAQSQDDEQGLASCESNNLVLPERIIKIPNLEKKLSNGGRKPGKARIITSTPNKEKLEASKKKKVKKTWLQHPLAHQ